MMVNCAEFRFYAELNDFLAPAKRYRELSYYFTGNPGIKDPIEAFGIPHSEVEIIVVNGASVGFEYRLLHHDRVAVYPVFESVDVAPIIRLREEPLRRTAFILDVNLGKLARWLRMLGFDTIYRNDLNDQQIVQISATEHRIIVTRDRRLLRHAAVTHGYWVRSNDPERQLDEVVRRFDLVRSINPFTRCMACNGLLRAVEKKAVIDELKPLTRKYYDSYHRCRVCRKLYWKGTHVERMRKKLGRIMSRTELGNEVKCHANRTDLGR